MLLTPGLKPADPAFESWWVRPGGATRVRVRPDDRLTVIDPDGGQPAELMVLGADPEALGVAARRAGDGARRARARARGRARDPPLRARRAARRARDVRRALGGDRRRRGARRPDRRRRLAGVGARRRAAARRAARRARRPSCRAPLAEPRLDFRVDKASALVLRGARGRVHPDHRRRRAPVLGLPRLPRAQARRRRRARPGPAGHAHADGHARTRRSGLHSKYYDADMDPLCQRRAGHRRAPRLVRAGVHRALLRGPRLPRPRQLHGELQPPARPVRDPRAQGLGGAELLLQHVVRPRPRAALRRAVVAARRLRAAARDVGPRLRLLGLPRRHRSRQRLGGHRRPRPRLLTGEPLLDGHRPPRHPGGRPRDDQGDGLPSTLVAADAQRHRVPRLLAADVLHQRGRGGGVLGLPREGRRDGPLAAAQVGDPRARRRGADAARGHARHPPARRRAGGLHGAVQRDRRDDRRRHRVPARRRQLPLRRRRRVRRRAPEAARRAARAARLGQAVDRPAAQPRRPGAGQPRRS